MTTAAATTETRAFRVSANAAELRRAVLAVAPSAARKDAGRPIFEGILVEARQGEDDAPGTLVLVATDGFRVAERTIPAEVERPGRRIVPAAAFAKAVKALIPTRAEGDATIATDGKGGLALTAPGGASSPLPLVEGEFVRYERIMPKRGRDHSVRVALSTAYLRDALSACDAAGTESVVLDVSDERQPVLLTSRDGQTARAIVMPVQLPG